MTTYKLYTSYVTEIPPAERENRSVKSPAWDIFETGCQTYMEQLALEFQTVVVTGSPTLVAVPGKPDQYIVCQAIVCSDKLL